MALGRGQGCSDQIFIIRHLMQQANETKVPLSLGFVLRRYLIAFQEGPWERSCSILEYLKSFLGSFLIYMRAHLVKCVCIGY